ncbi:MAG TPA: hypothetical protein VFH78_05025 [Candidatus Thermoplasmatota archaeon]|nr:hypothetical protein [Candidatus Thermoplasmatota archaeon]
MRAPATAPPAFVLMKVGFHADEGLEPILARKRRELEQVGVSFWGYGGRACHPRTQVQPFARSLDGPVWAALVTTPSPFAAEPRLATAFSADGAHWSTLPRGVTVTASEHALVCDALEDVDWTIDLAQHVVAVGPSAGTRASEYVRFRVDKACLRRDDAAPPGGPVLRATHALRLREPYGVTLRG